LQRILRAARGSSEAEARVARLDVHADAAGLAVALLARSSTATDVAALLQRGLKLGDGLLFAALVETLWALGRRADVKTLVDAVAARRKDDPSALAAWLVVGDLDRTRSTSVLAGALDAP